MHFYDSDMGESMKEWNRPVVSELNVMLTKGGSAGADEFELQYSFSYAHNDFGKWDVSMLTPEDSQVWVSADENYGYS